MPFLVQAALLLFLKLVLIAGIARRVRHLFPDSLACAWLAGWLGVQAMQLVGMACLSLGHLLTPAGWWSWTALEFAAVATLGIKTREPIFPSRASLPGLRTPLLFLAFVTALVFFRAVFFFDTSFDSYCYGLVRIGYFFQHRSILAHTASGVLKIVCYEWNAELNALNYGLFTGTDRAFPLAGFEAWWVAVVAVFALARATGGAVVLSVWIGLLVGCTPAIFNLAGVIKGDVPAMSAVICALTHLLRMRRIQWRDPDFALAFFWLAFGAGCKGTLAPVFALFAIASFVLSRWENCGAPLGLRQTAVFGAVATPFFLRHALNTLVFHNPLQRVPYETTCTFSVANIGAALETQFCRFFSFSDLMPSTAFTSTLVRGFGVTGWVTLLAFVLTVPAWRRSRSLLPPSSTLLSVFILCLGVVWLYLCGMFPVIAEPYYRVHMFRFFLPFLTPAAVAVICRFSHTPLGARQKLWTVAGGLAVCVNLILAFRPSEVMVTAGLRRLAAHALHHDQFASRLREEFQKDARQSLGGLVNKRGQKQRLLIVEQAEIAPVYPFFGDRFEWNCEMAVSLDGLKSSLAHERFDRVVLAKGVGDDFARGASPLIADAHYQPEFDGKHWTLYRP